jgi:cytidylate kinase
VQALAAQAGAIAIDGQVAAGKTVVGRELARRLGCPYLDTGIMYRAITWLALRRAVSMEDAPALGNLARNATLRLKGPEGDAILLDDGEKEHELGPELRAPEIDRQVSLVAKVSEVRRELVRQQRAIAAQACRAEGSIVMVGRDIGTVVLPDATLKVYMTASPEVRARRRHAELLAQGNNLEYAADFNRVLAETITRDNIDSQRADSPLAQAPDALLVNTDDRTVEQVVDFILESLEWVYSRAGTADS